MARGGRGGPADRAWRAAVLLGLVLIAGAFAFALLYPLAFGDGCPCRDRAGRLVVVVANPRDLWIAVDAARYVANGALGFVYESSRFLTALPLYPICWRHWWRSARRWGYPSRPPPQPPCTSCSRRSPSGSRYRCSIRSAGSSGTPARAGRGWLCRSGRRCWSAYRC